MLKLKEARMHTASKEDLRGFRLTRLSLIASSPTQLYKIRPHKVLAHQNNFKQDLLLSHIKQK